VKLTVRGAVPDDALEDACAVSGGAGVGEGLGEGDGDGLGFEDGDGVGVDDGVGVGVGDGDGEPDPLIGSALMVCSAATLPG
jgi:hypothetical protein